MIFLTFYCHDLLLSSWHGNVYLPETVFYLSPLTESILRCGKTDSKHEFASKSRGVVVKAGRKC